MAETNRDQWVQNFANAIGANNQQINNDPNNGGSNTTNDKYAALETTSYKDMLSSKIQAANAKDQAYKYANASLSASGLGNQGIAESTRAGIYGNYQRAIQEADTTHQSNLLDIATQRATEQEEKQESSWQSAMTMLQQAQSQEDLDYLKNNFYGNMTDEQKKMFDYYYASYSKDLASGDNTEWASRVFSTTELSEDDGITYNSAVQTDAILKQIDKDGKTKGTDDLKNFYMTANNGDLIQIDYVAKNGSGTKYAMYYNGKLYYVDSALLNGRTASTTYTVNLPNVNINN